MPDPIPGQVPDEVHEGEEQFGGDAEVEEPVERTIDSEV